MSTYSRIEDIPDNPLYTQLWGDGYRSHPEFIAHMSHVVNGTRALRYVIEDLKDAQEYRSGETKTESSSPESW